MPLKVTRTVTVKAVVTEELKARLGAELRAALTRLDAELDHLTPRERGPSAKTRGDAPSAGEAGIAPGGSSPGGGAGGDVAEERRRRLQQKEQVLARLKELARLELGSEIVQGTVEGQVEVKTGDDWQRLFAAEIVLRDGKVVAVRE